VISDDDRPLLCCSIRAVVTISEDKWIFHEQLCPIEVFHNFCRYSAAQLISHCRFHASAHIFVICCYISSVLRV